MVPQHCASWRAIVSSPGGHLCKVPLLVRHSFHSTSNPVWHHWHVTQVCGDWPVGFCCNLLAAGLGLAAKHFVWCRYDHFKDKPATLLLKMVQFVTVVVNDDQNKFTDGVERSST